MTTRTAGRVTASTTRAGTALPTLLLLVAGLGCATDSTSPAGTYAVTLPVTEAQLALDSRPLLTRVELRESDIWAVDLA
jgi:hypothetical protein